MTTIPSDAAFHLMLVRTIALGLVAFFVSGGLLLSFWKSLGEESESGRRQLGPRSRARLLWLIASLLVISAMFMVLGLRE